MPNTDIKGASKEVRQLLREVIDHGWQVERRKKSSHFVMTGPNGQKVFCASTPSDHRAVKGIKKDLAKAGLDLR